MKKTGFIFLFLIFATVVEAQLNKHLCKDNEEVVFAFEVKDQKWVSVCRSKTGEYLVYRFGTQNKIELEYPSILDSTSWNKFTFNGYSRGGGKDNAALRFAYLEFNNNDIEYEIYDLWNSEDDISTCGIWIRPNTKPTDLRGNLKSRKGALLELLYENRIKKQPQD